ncbi:hypothetical protein ACCT30_49080, partial [Rhizobium ruizarguesonis]
MTHLGRSSALDANAGREKRRCSPARLDGYGLPEALLRAEIHAIKCGGLTGDDMCITLAESNRP